MEEHYPEPGLPAHGHGLRWADRRALRHRRRGIKSSQVATLDATIFSQMFISVRQVALVYDFYINYYCAYDSYKVL